MEWWNTMAQFCVRCIFLSWKLLAQKFYHLITHKWIFEEKPNNPKLLAIVKWAHTTHACMPYSGLYSVCTICTDCFRFLLNKFNFMLDEVDCPGIRLLFQHTNIVFFSLSFSLAQSLCFLDLFRLKFLVYRLDRTAFQIRFLPHLQNKKRLKWINTIVRFIFFNLFRVYIFFSFRRRTECN